MKKQSKVIVTLIVIAMIIGVIAFNWYRVSPKTEFRCVSGLTSEQVDQFSDITENGEEFSMGLDKKGVPVFSDPKVALKTVSDKYREGVDLLYESTGAWKMVPLKWNVKKFLGDVDIKQNAKKEEIEQALFVLKVLDIYENSVDGQI